MHHTAETGSPLTDPKIRSKEKKILDTSAKLKDRWRALYALQDDGIKERDVHTFYQKNSDAIMEMCAEQLRGMVTLHVVKGKQVGMELVVAVLDVIKLLILVNKEKVRSGWQREWFGNELAKATHPDNILYIRRYALDILLTLLSTVGFSDRNLKFTLLVAMELRETPSSAPRYSFLPGCPNPSDAVELYSDFFTHCHTRSVADPVEARPFWWGFAKEEIVPRVTGRRCHTFITHYLYPLLQNSNTINTILSTREDVLIVISILKVNVCNVDTQEDLILGYKLVRITTGWVSEQYSPSPNVIQEHPEECLSWLLAVLSGVFQCNPDLKTATPGALRVWYCTIEMVVEAFINTQIGAGLVQRIKSSSLDNVKNEVLQTFTMEIFRKMFLPESGGETGTMIGSVVTEAKRELTSRAFWTLLLLNRPTEQQFEAIQPILDAATSSPEPNEKKTVQAAFIPCTSCIVGGPIETFSVSPVVTHWRIAVLAMLRLMIGTCSDITLSFPFSSLVVKTELAGLGGGDEDVVGLLGVHKQRQQPIEYTVQKLVEGLDTKQIAKLWTSFVMRMCNGSELKSPPPIHLAKMHTVSDVVADLLFAAHSHRMVEPRRKVVHDGLLTAPSHLLSSIQRPLPLQKSVLPHRVLCKLFLPILLRGFRRGSSVAELPIVSVATICDLLTMGHQIESSYLSVIIVAISKALSGADTRLLRVVIYRLFPCNSTGSNTQAAHVFVSHHTGCLPLLAPMVIGAYVYLTTQPSPERDPKREVSVRCAAVSLLLWAASVCIGRSDETVEWPVGYKEAGIVASTMLQSSLNRPKKYKDLFNIAVGGITAGMGGYQDTETRVLSIKALSVCMLKNKDPALLKCLSMRFFDTDARVAVAAAEETPTIAEVCRDNLPQAFQDELIAYLASGLLFSTFHNRNTSISTPIEVTSSLTHGVHTALLNFRPSEKILNLAIDSLSYSISGRTQANWYLPITTQNLTSPVQASTTPYANAVLITEKKWWTGVEATTVQTIKDTASVVLHHIVTWYRLYPVEGLGPSMVSTATTPDLTCFDFHQTYLKSGEALVSLSESEDTRDFLLTSRSEVGRASWKVKQVRDLQSSLFSTNSGVGYGHFRSKSGAVMGRVRTCAMHESCSVAASGSGNDQLKDLVHLYTPGYQIHHTPVSVSLPVPSSVSATPLSPLSKTGNACISSTTPSCPPCNPPAGILSREFLASHVLADFHQAAYPTFATPTPPVGLRLAGDDPNSVLHSLLKLDETPERERICVAVMCVLEGQVNSSEILSNSHAACGNEYKSFVNGLGWKVDLKTHKGYTGGVQYDEEAHPSMVYYATPTTEIAFHVCTIVGGVNDAGQEQRRRMISGDTLQIIWTEDNKPYNTHTVNTPNAHTWVVLQYIGHNLVRLSVASKLERIAGPLLDGLCLPLPLVAPLLRIFAARVLCPVKGKALLARRRAVEEASTAFRRSPPTLSQMTLPMFANQHQVVV